ncbi:DarT ssDNA thymidine ADP-ribosyltransferase family protein, partial [Pseudomonas savastanoi]|uniref:DarT ssDNA thymidine ADP-ribosyltransferase family protein n=1 Tax=Pseudomonas savastanoi TaxID=29438 RepID=UPI0009BF49ED
FSGARSIESVLHFTTNRGALGVFASRALKSRQRLNADQQLKHIFQPNARFRDKDLAWLDYANLSISQINTAFFKTCAGSWHKEKDFFWCILDFSPSIMLHDDVWFTTTNNIYTGVKRARGVEGLEAVFQPTTHQFLGNYARRPADHPSNLPTCYQAEILYPLELSTDHLQRIYVHCDNDTDELAGQMAATGHPQVEVVVRPELFEGIR